MSALRDAQLFDDTAVFLFADHGDYTGDYDTVEKCYNSFEDCLTRVPFVMKPPADVPTSPGVRNQLTELVDFSATVHALCGIDPGYDSFGQSLLPLLADPEADGRDAVFTEGGFTESEVTHAPEGGGDRTDIYWPTGHLRVSLPEAGKAISCRTPCYRYVRRAYERDELYDLRSDPEQLVNRIDDPAMADARAEMVEHLLHHYLLTSDVTPQVQDARELGDASADKVYGSGRS